MVSFAGAGAFLLGWMAGEPDGATLSETGTISPLPQIASAQVGTAESPRGAVPTSASFSPEQMRARAFQILSIPDRLERMRQFTDLLSTLTPENWASIFDAFTVQRRSEGRIFRNEASLLLSRIGEVCGVAAIDQALAGKIPNGGLMVPDLLQGWASAEPAAAIAWFRGRRADEQKGLISMLIQGVGRSDPKLAFTLLREAPENSWRSSTMHIFEGAIEMGGFQKAEQLFAELRAEQGTPRGLLQEVMISLVERRLQIATQTGDSSTLLAWFDPYFPPDVVNLDRGDPSETLMRNAFRADGEGAIAWLDARADRLEADRAQKLYRALGAQWTAGGLSEVTRWIRANPRHPQQRVIASGAALALTDVRKFAEARAISELIQDAETRTRLTQQIQSLEETRAKERARSVPNR